MNGVPAAWYVISFRIFMNETHEKTNHVYRPLAVSTEKPIWKISRRYILYGIAAVAAAICGINQFSRYTLVPAKRALLQIRVYYNTRYVCARVCSKFITRTYNTSAYTYLHRGYPGYMYIMYKPRTSVLGCEKRVASVTSVCARVLHWVPGGVITPSSQE